MNSNKVYITTSNWYSIVREIDTSGHQFDQKSLYKSDLSKILSIPELNLLCKLKEAFESEDFILERYKKLKNREDTKTFVYEGGTPSYHFSESCKKLNSNFLNLEIPAEVKSRGDSEINKFRSFCKSNMDLLNQDESAFITKLEAHFFLVNRPQKISHANSGHMNIENLSLPELEEAIDNLLIDADIFRNQSDQVRAKIKNMGYGTHKIKEAKVEGSTLNIWHNDYKERLKALLREYFRVKLNPELTFEGGLLEQLGFNPCTYCRS